MATELKVKVGDSGRLNEQNVPLKDGQWIICKDTGEMFFDEKNEQGETTRYPIGGISEGIDVVKEKEYVLIDGTIVESGVDALVMNDTEEVEYSTKEMNNHKVFIHNGCYRLETNNIVPDTFQLYKGTGTARTKIAEQGLLVSEENQNIYYLTAKCVIDRGLEGWSSTPISGIFAIESVEEIIGGDPNTFNVDLVDCEASITLHVITDQQAAFLQVGNMVDFVCDTPNEIMYSATKFVIYSNPPIGTINLLSGYIEFSESFLNDNISNDGTYKFSELYATYQYKQQTSGNIAAGNWSLTSGQGNTNISGKGTVSGEKNYLQGGQGRVSGMHNVLYSYHGSADGYGNFVETTKDPMTTVVNDSVVANGYGNYVLDSPGAEVAGHNNIILNGRDSTAKGFRNIIKALYAFVHGQHNIATNDSQTVVGKFNDYKKSKENGDLFTVGNGKNFENGKALVRSNAFGVKEDGTAYVKEQGDSADSVVKREYVEQEVEKLYSQINTLTETAPEFANDISECTDTSKVYILPDGYIYAYTKEIPEVEYSDMMSNTLLTLNKSEGKYMFAYNAQYSLKYTKNIIPAQEGQIFEYLGFSPWQPAVYWLKNPVNDINEGISLDNIVGFETTPSTTPDGAAIPSGTEGTYRFTAPKDTNYALFVTIDNSPNYMKFQVTPPSMYYWKNTGTKTTIEYCIKKAYELERTSGVLANKKYVACGDSFTAAQKDGSFDTYPALIAKRNYNMQLVNLAVSGSDFTNIEGANIPFAADATGHVSYKDIPLDADYITLMFGLNECINPTDPEDPRNMPELGDSSSIYKPGVDVENIGEISTDDYDDTNLWGAYSKVFDYLLSNAPYAKIGVIIADAWMTEEYATAVKGVCRYWGIPYLDLNAEDVPMGIRGRYWSETAAGTVSKRAISLRDAAFKTSSTDEHPNAKAHEYRSTIIENFLRSL